MEQEWSYDDEDVKQKEDLYFKGVRLDTASDEEDTEDEQESEAEE